MQRKSKRKNRKYAQRTTGFTLVEVMIVVAIIAIIAAIAIPSYNNSVIKSKRAIGKAELLEVLSMQEQYFVNNKAYATTLTALGYGANPYFIDKDGNALPNVAGSIYQIALSGASANAFTIQAIPKNSQADDTDCSTLQISNTGLKSISNDANATVSQCW